MSDFMMVTCNSTDDFLQMVVRSGLLDQHRLDVYLRKFGSTLPLPTEPAALAGHLVRDGVLTHYQVRQLLSGKWQRFVLMGKYKILEVLGSGGMGKVFLCEHLLLRKRVAVKVLPVARSQNAQALERFYREARAIASLDHPNIVRCFDMDADGQLHFMVMEYVDGASLEAIVKRHGPLASLRVAHYIRQAALGLHHASECGWIHRDVKPANILVDRGGVIKVLDLGLARLFLDSGENITAMHSENLVLGTADYISPEQAISSHEVDLRADIYSLGATAYFLLTGTPPFPGGTAAQKLIWHQVRMPTPLLQLQPRADPDLVALVERMMAKDPDYRFPSHLEVATELERWTATPIPLPTADELADPALAGSAVSSASGPGAVHSAGSAAGPRGSLSTANSIAGNTPANNQPPTVVLSVPPPIPRTSPSTVRMHRSSSDTFRSGLHLAPPQVPATPPVAPPPRRSRRTALVLLGVAAVAGMLVAGYFQLPRGAAPATTAAKSTVPAGPQPLLVTRNRLHPQAGKPHVCDSVAQALTRAKKGDRIQLLDDVHEEILNLTPGTVVPPDVIIEGANAAGKEVVWQLPAAVSEDRPLLTMTDVVGLRLKNLHFDGEARASVLLALTGRCPGLTLENVTLRGISGAGIQLRGCQGEPARPVALQAVRFVAAKQASAALVFAVADSQHVLVKGCRFEGAFQAAIQIDAPLGHANLQGNRFHTAQAAFAWTNGSGRALGPITIRSNTFADVATTLRIDGIDAPASLLLENNLFARTPAMVAADSPLAVASLTALTKSWQGNGRDADSCLRGPVPLRSEPLTFTLGTDAAKDATFLRYGADSPLRTAGADGGPIGAAP